MSTSLITRCPKCSTAFRVSDDVLSMAKGKVRCGQCFHIFEAQKHQKAPNNTAPASAFNTSQQATNTPTATPSESNKQQAKPSKPSPAPQAEIELEDLPVNPEWLNTLFDDEDSPVQEKPPARPAKAPQASILDKVPAPTKDSANRPELAPWEVELAEVEAALKVHPPTANRPTHTPPATPPQNTDVSTATFSATAATTAAEPEPEPDYMVALHSLAQSASEQHAKPADQHSVLEQLHAQQNLAPLLEEDQAPAGKNRRTWLWLMGVLAGSLLLAAQVTMHFFEAGSHSASFRSFYRTLCTYTDCTLPAFEDVKAISIQHVRIQSHPSQANVLLVNAILTNTSAFSQAMPKIALEFFDLNGAPVAARLFAPNNYLHKDFLDITYMPPNTPIHVVIAIQDPGARAVTHQLKALPAGTASY